MTYVLFDKVELLRCCRPCMDVQEELTMIGRVNKNEAKKSKEYYRKQAQIWQILYRPLPHYISGPLYSAFLDD